MTDTSTNIENRDKTIARIVIQMEAVESDLASAREDMKTIAQSCKEAGITKAQVTAMKRLAKLRATDKFDTEREKMATLRSVGTAIGADLFAWAAAQGGTDGG